MVTRRQRNTMPSRSAYRKNTKNTSRTDNSRNRTASIKPSQRALRVNTMMAVTERRVEIAMVEIRTTEEVSKMMVNRILRHLKS